MEFAKEDIFFSALFPFTAMEIKSSVKTKHIFGFSLMKIKRADNYSKAFQSQFRIIFMIENLSPLFVLQYQSGDVYHISTYYKPLVT